MIEIDGSEGGGQFLRSALSLSALTGQPFRIEDIRGGRPKPGLRPQHLTAVELLADICDADVAEPAVGTDSLTFDPAAVRPGTYEADIGTAGSITLLFDTVLPLAVATSGPLVVTARGGTDVKWSPSMAHYRRVKLALLRRFGLQALVEVDRPGFYPAGGGEATLRMGPTDLAPVELGARDTSGGEDVEAARVYSLSSMDLAEQAVAPRQAEAAVDGLDAAGIPTVETVVRAADADSAGSAIGIRLDLQDSIAGFDALGEPGTPAEDVAATAVGDATTFVENTAGAVDRHTADQLLVFLALAGGRVAIPELTDHVTTSLDLLAEFGLEIDVEWEGGMPVVTAAGTGDFSTG